MADDFTTAAGAGAPGGNGGYEFEWQNPNRKPAFEVGRVVSNTFRALRENPVPFLLLTLIGTGIPMMLFSLWPLFLGMDGGINIYDPTWAEKIEWEGIIGIAALFYLLYMMVIVLMIGALIHMSVKALNGRPVDVGEALRTGLKLFFPVLGVFVLYMIGTVIGTLLLIIPGIFIMLGWGLAMNIRVIEGGTVTGALSRSWSLTKGYKRWFLLMLIIFGVLGAVIGLIFQLPVLFFGNSQTALIEGGSTTFWVVNAIGSGLAQMVSAALSYVGMTATYLEIRRVKEGVNSDSVADIFS